MREEVSAGMVICHRDKTTNLRNYLILQAGTGYWDLPKGKLEKDETPRDAAIREVKEETNLDVTPLNEFQQRIEYFFKDRDGLLVHKTVTYFYGETDKPDNVQLSDEHLAFIWLPFDEAQRKLTFTNARQLLQMAEQHASHLYPEKGPQ